MTEFTIRVGVPEDVEEMVALLPIALGAEPRLSSDAFWRWKHLDSPFGASSVMLAIDASGAIIGLRVFLRWTLRAGDQTLRAVRAVDTATHPDWRRMGVFAKLNAAMLERVRAEGAPFVFNTPNAMTRRGNLKQGWQDVATIPLRGLVLHPLRMATRAAAFKLGRRLEVAQQNDDFSVAALLADGRLPDVLAAATPRDERLHTERTVEYLRWRFEQIPEHTYQARWRFEGSDGGIAIVRSKPRFGAMESAVCEVLATPGSRGRSLARKALIDAIADAPGDYIVAMAAPASTEGELLSDALFSPGIGGVGPRLTVRLLGDSTVPDPRALESWRLTAGDLELF